MVKRINSIVDILSAITYNIVNAVAKLTMLYVISSNQCLKDDKMVQTVGFVGFS